MARLCRASPPPGGFATAFDDRHMPLREPPSLDVSVVVPYFDPGQRVVETLERLRLAMVESQLRYEVIAVSDGSGDGSAELVEQIQDPHLRRVRLDRNQGKGAALRFGLSQARGRICGFIDGDGDLDPAQVPSLCALLSPSAPCDVVVGSKRHPGSEVVYPPLRRMYSWGFQQLAHVLFDLQVRDTQVGVKFFRRQVLAEVLPLTVECHFAFDLEVLVLCARLGYTSVQEVPVRIGRRFSSSISLRAVVQTLADTVGIWWRLRTCHVPTGEVRCEDDDCGRVRRRLHGSRLQGARACSSLS